MPYLLSIVLALIVVFPALAGNPLLPGIKGADDRVLVSSTEMPWRAIGRLNKRTGGHCTAALVGPRTVLTAAHCLWNKRMRRFLPVQSLHFVAGWSKGDYLAHAKAASIYVPAKYDGLTPRSSKTLNHDWAVVTLTDDIGSTLGYFDVTAMDARGLSTYRKRKASFIQAGYSQDKKHILSVHRGCALDGMVKGHMLIAHRCDAVPGDSGSPIFLAEKGRYTITAIHVATRKTTKGTFGLAVPGISFAEAILAQTSRRSKLNQ